jgi:hypothetical protein
MKFRILWGFDLLIALVVVFFFFWGLSDGTVSAFNIGLWLVLLLGVQGCRLGRLEASRGGPHRARDRTPPDPGVSGVHVPVVPSRRPDRTASMELNGRAEATATLSGVESSRSAT